eukprot:15361043-Ditylum_brightwellii.AAC.1
MPPIPTTECVCLQFVQKNAYYEAVEKFTDLLWVKHTVQSRTPRKEHMDQSWLSAFTRYYHEFLIELRKVYPGVKMVGQDDKAKVPLGDKVHVSIGAHPNNTDIVSVNDIHGLRELDHEFHLGGMIPSVTLQCTIPSDISGSFFIGNEGRYGQIFVTLYDAVFDGSEIFDHCAQLIDIIWEKKVKQTILLLQTGGGPDHSLRQVAIKLVLITLFKELDLDKWIVLCGAPNGSASNIVERSMSIINLEL